MLRTMAPRAVKASVHCAKPKAALPVEDIFELVANVVTVVARQAPVESKAEA